MSWLTQHKTADFLKQQLQACKSPWYLWRRSQSMAASVTATWGVKCTWALTINGGEHHSGVVVGNDVCIAILWLVDFHVGVLPGKLLAWINGLWERAGKKRDRKMERAIMREWTERHRQKERKENRSTKGGSWVLHEYNGARQGGKGIGKNYTTVCCHLFNCSIPWTTKPLNGTYTNIMSLEKPQWSATGERFYTVGEMVQTQAQSVNKAPYRWLHCNYCWCVNRLITAFAFDALNANEDDI